MDTISEMSNTQSQKRSSSSSKSERSELDKAREDLLRRSGPPDDVIEAISQTDNRPIRTPAEILTDTHMDLEDKKIELMRAYGRKGGLVTAKKKTKFKEVFISAARKLAAIGISEADIAVLFGVNKNTLSGWKRAHSSFRDALKEGESLKRSNLLQQMQASAFSGIFQMQIFLAKNWLGMTDKQDLKHSGEQTITYKSHIPKEKGSPDIDPGSKKQKVKGLPGARTRKK